MPHKKEPWRDAFDEAVALGLKVSVVTKGAACLAIGGWTECLPEQQAALYGVRWLEYIIPPDDAPRVAAWFAEDSPGEAITYLGTGLHNGKIVAARIVLVKRWAVSAWLVYGDSRPARLPQT